MAVVKKNTIKYEYNTADFVCGRVLDGAGQIQEILIYSYSKGAVVSIASQRESSDLAAYSGHPILQTYRITTEIFDKDMEFRIPKRVAHAVIVGLSRTSNRIDVLKADAQMYRKECERLESQVKELQRALSNSGNTPAVASSKPTTRSKMLSSYDIPLNQEFAFIMEAPRVARRGERPIPAPEE